MKKTYWIFMMFLVAALILNAVPAFAKRGGGGSPGGFSHGEKKGWGENETPPGWSHGEKKGWDDEDMPPGLFQHEDDEKGKDK